MPEIIRPDKGSETPNQEGNKFPDFQEANPMESSPSHTDHNDFCEVNATNPEQNMGSLSTGLFEEKLKEINRDLRKFDVAIEFHSESNSSTSKENNLESMTINEIFLKSTQSCATPHGLSHAPLSVIPKLQTST